MANAIVKGARSRAASKATPKSERAKKAKPAKSGTKRSASGKPHWSDKVVAGLEAETSGFLTKETVMEIDKVVHESGPSRRICLFFLTRTWKEVRDEIIGDDEAASTFAMMLEHMKHHADMLREILRLCDMSVCRTAAALAYREDMKALLDKAKADFEGGYENG